MNVDAVKTKLYGRVSTNFYPYFPRKISVIKIYNTVALPTLLYGIEIWTLRRRDKKRLISIEMKFFRRTS
jgi:hypothetical protein